MEEGHQTRAIIVEVHKVVESWRRWGRFCEALLSDQTAEHHLTYLSVHVVNKVDEEEL